MFLRNRAALLLVLTLPMLAACDRIASRFVSNTELGKLQLSVQRVANTTQDDVSEIMTNERLRYMLRVLAHKLPVGAEITVDPTASEFGMYLYGAGWVSSGEHHLGRHDVRTDTVEVFSSDVDVLAVEAVPDTSFPTRQLVRLTTLKPGIARITFKTSKLDKKMQRYGELIEDSIVVTVTERPETQGNSMAPKREN